MRRRDDAQALRELQKLPNVGPAVAGDLLRLGIRRQQELRGRDPERLYEELCLRDGVRHDPCMRDVLEAVVAHANGEPSRPWWHFSRKRKSADRTGRRAPRRRLRGSGSR